MSGDELQTAVVTAESVAQDVQNETTTNPSPSVAEINADVVETVIVSEPSETLEHDSKTADGEMDVDKTEDTDVPHVNEVESVERKDAPVEDEDAVKTITDEEVQDVKKDATMEKEGDDGMESNNVSAVEANGETGKAPDVEMIKRNTVEEERKEGAADVNKESVIEDSKEDGVQDIKEDADDDPKEDATEEVKEDAAEEVKEDTEKDAKEDAVEEIKEDAVEEVKEDTAEEVKEDASEEVKEDASEEVKEDASEEVKEDASKDVKENAAEDAKENAIDEVIDITMEEDDSEPVATPSKATRKRSKRVVESPYSPRGSKRERKAANHFEPGNFKDERQKNSLSPQPGRGTALKDIPKIKSKIDRFSLKDPTLAASHKFVYGGRGNVAKKLIKKQLLEFSGFLLADDEGQEKVEDDDAILRKMSTRAYKMTIPLLKTVCDLFDVDRQPDARKKAVLDKEGIVDKLLTFLASPDIKLTNGGRLSTKKRSRSSISKSPKTKKSKKAEDAEVVVLDDEDDEEMEEEEEESEEEEEEKEEVGEGSRGKKMPTKRELRKFVKAYVTCFSMEKTTSKHLIQTASDKFDVDVSSKKKDILELLTAEMPSETGTL